jgi:hypothetical protein
MSRNCRRCAELEAQIAKLRDALENHNGNYKLTKSEGRAISDLLALPSDDSALRARLAQERERVAKATEAHIPGFGNLADPWTAGYVQALQDVAEGIRNLGDAQ